MEAYKAVLIRVGGRLVVQSAREMNFVEKGMVVMRGAQVDVPRLASDAVEIPAACTEAAAKVLFREHDDGVPVVLKVQTSKPVQTGDGAQLTESWSV